MYARKVNAPDKWLTESITSGVGEFIDDQYHCVFQSMPSSTSRKQNIYRKMEHSRFVRSYFISGRDYQSQLMFVTWSA